MKKIVLLISFALINIFTFAQNDADIDPTFNIGSGFNDVVYCIKQQPDGKILVGGKFSSYNGIDAEGIIRLNIDGSIDNTFNVATALNGGAYRTVFAIELQTDGKILVGGNFEAYTINTTLAKKIIRLNSNGSVDNSFTPGIGFNGDVHSIKAIPGGNILICGRFTIYKTSAAHHFAVLYTNGNFAGAFNAFPSTLGFDSVKAIALHPLGKVILVGNITQYGGATSNRIISFNSSSGAPDSTFNIGTGFNESVHNIALQPNGQIILVGSFTSYNGFSSNRIARLNNNGSIDTSFNIGTGFNIPAVGVIEINTGFNPAVETVQLQNDGKILVGGYFTTYNSNLQRGLIRLNNDGTKDFDFNIGSGFLNSINFGESGITNILQQTDGKILVGGNFTTYKGINASCFIRLKGTANLKTNDFIKSKVSIYPNPVKDILNLSLSENTNIESYEIYDLLGKKVISEKTTENKINVNQLNKGIYLLKAFTNEAIFTNKFIKE